MRDSFVGPVAAPPVRGWLLVLCGFFLVYQPVSLGLASASVLDALAIRGAPFALLLVARSLAAGVGIATGMAILRRASSGINLARTALTASVLTDTLVYTTPYYPTNVAPGDAPWLLAAVLVHYAGWMLYLARSKRVRGTLVSPASPSASLRASL